MLRPRRAVYFWKMHKIHIIRGISLLSSASAMEGCIHRIRQCAIELLAMEGDLIDGDEDSLELVGQELQLKSTFLYCDLNQVIRVLDDDDHKGSVTDLANRLLYCIEELGEAVKNRNRSMGQICYNEISEVVQELMDALPPIHSVESDVYWEDWHE